MTKQSSTPVQLSWSSSWPPPSWSSSSSPSFLYCLVIVVIIIISSLSAASSASSANQQQMFLLYPVLYSWTPKLSLSSRAGKYCSSLILQPAYLGLSYNVFKPQLFTEMVDLRLIFETKTKGFWGIPISPILETSPCCCVLALFWGRTAAYRAFGFSCSHRKWQVRRDGMACNQPQWYTWSLEIWVDEAWKAIQQQEFNRVMPGIYDVAYLEETSTKS